MLSLLHLAPATLMLSALPARSAEVSAAGWYAATASESCDAACETQGLTCTEQQSHAHNGEIDSETEAVALLSNLTGIQCNLILETQDNPQSATTIYYTPWAYEMQPGFYYCNYAGPDRLVSFFDCARIPAEEGFIAMSRLCYCHHDDTSTNTSTSTLVISTTSETMTSVSATSETTSSESSTTSVSTTSEPDTSASETSVATSSFTSASAASAGKVSTTELDFTSESDIAAETTTPHTTGEASATDMIVESSGCYHGVACSSLAAIAAAVAASLYL